MTTADIYAQTVAGFSNLHVLVIGDLMLDVYLNGTSRRLCPEAPVPVVDIQRRTALPGGAANTASNLRALGARVYFCSIVGKDAGGDEILDVLEKLGVDHSGIVRDRDRNTMTKTRVVADKQVITRLDEGTEEPASAEWEALMIERIEQTYAHCDAVIISDYNKGVVTPAVLELLTRLREKEPRFIAVDSKRLPFFSLLNPSYVKPNYGEATSILSLRHEPENKVEQLSAHARQLYELTGAPLITATLDSEGSILIEKGEAVEVFAAPYVFKPQVAGAGDTYLSAFVLAYLVSGQGRISAGLATAAAAIAVKKEGTSCCTTAELQAYFNLHDKLVSGHAELAALCDTYHEAGRRIVFTNGCFDILHSGHVAYLRRAKELGDVLIVGLNTDESIRRIKGKERPINALADRLQVLAGLSSVDHVIAFGDLHDDTPVPLIRIVRPHVFAKGGDYTKEKLPEAETVEAFGGRIVLLDHIPDHSTTRIISRITEISGPRKKPILASSPR